MPKAIASMSFPCGVFSNQYVEKLIALIVPTSSR
jgi:hypothetical protein